ncbi:MAG: recombinase zinc beta ribbon domain-containing protein, partial [bacterium]
LPAGYESARIEEQHGSRVVVRQGPLRKRDGASEVIGRAYETRASGGSWSEVARVLTRGGIVTNRGTANWTTQAARALVKNPIYKGVFTCQCGCVDGDGNRTSVLRADLAMTAPSIWKKAQPAVGVSRGRKDPGHQLLAGLVKCGGCGRTMQHTRPMADKDYRYYYCRRGDEVCQARAKVLAVPLEEFLREDALFWFAQADLYTGHDTDVETLAKLEHRRDDARARLAALVRLIDPLDPGAAERLAEARDEVNAAETALVEEQTASRERVTEAQVKELYANAPLDEQRGLLRTVYESVTIAPGRAPLEERVSLSYRNKTLAAALAV